jgi:hypothetical protein
MRTITAICAAVACLIAAPSALAATTGPHTETETAGPVTATLTYTMKSEYEASDLRLAITRNGVPATLEGGTNPNAGCGEGCEVAIPIGALSSPGNKLHSITLTDLDGNGETEVIVDTYTGGAHCCSISAIYGWDPATNQYRHLVQFWGDPGYRLEDLGGAPGQELVSADPRFAYTFCAYVCSAMPVLVYRYQDFQLVDVTKQFPLQMRQQNRELRRIISRNGRKAADRFVVRGMLPALCANLYRLGEGASCRAQLQTALKRGWLAQEPGDKAAHWAGGKQYIARVERTLAKYGYTR